MGENTTIPDVTGLPLSLALLILKEHNIKPKVVFSMPERIKEEQNRTARVIRLTDEVLLCSNFLDSLAETRI